MESAALCCVPSFHKSPPPTLHKTIFTKTTPLPRSSSPSCFTINCCKQTSSSSSKLNATVSSSSPPPETTVSPETQTLVEKFDWYSHWYPVMPVSDLDKRVPHAKKILGIDLVVWWDRNENEWKVFDDTCPHRLAPLSQGRIDQLGRLQCVYHGWCFNGSGNCQLIPQASPDGPPVHTFKKACVGAYPTVVQHDMLWFWPSSDPQYKDIIKEKQPPYIPELDHSSSPIQFMHRDFPFGYEVLTENIMDPAHVPYAHFGIMQIDAPPKVKVDREGGKPLNLGVEKLDVNGYFGRQEWGSVKFTAPCTFVMYTVHIDAQGNGSDSSSATDKIAFGQKLSEHQSVVLVFYFIPISPGNSRMIWGASRQFASWVDSFIPHWLMHAKINLLVDSDLYLLHMEERRIMELAGTDNWHKSCFVPTKSDALVVGFRRWLNKYAGCQVDWRGKFRTTDLPLSLPKEQLMDKYSSHVVNCKSCSSAYKALNALEVILQIASIVSIGIVAATPQRLMSTIGKTTVVSVTIVCFAASKWLAHFIYQTFHFQDYDHSLK